MAARKSSTKTAAKPAAPKVEAAAKPAAIKPAKAAAPKPAAPKSAPRKPAAKAAAKPTAKATTKPASKPASPPATASLPSRALGVFSIGAALVAVGAAIVETVSRLRGRGGEGHQAPDLALDHDRAPEDRAPDAFRPDPTAAVPAGEREALRPATLPLGSGRELDSVH